MTTSNKPRIIVIDDSKLMRVSLKNVLKDEFEITEAEDGTQGWERVCNDTTLQVVITDAQMPGIDGYELIKRVRQSDLAHVRNIPIMMITGADDETARARALEAGATDFITKPFDKSQLLARTRAHAKLDQTARALAENSAVDALTGISSRRYFLERGLQDLAFARRRGQDMTVISVGVDKFASLTQTHGTAIGDRLLSWIAKKLKETIRTEDTVARTGDAAFAILAATSGRLEAAVLCERARKLISTSPLIEGNVAIPLSVSLGLASLGHDKPENVEKFLALAEHRAARALAEGGNRIIASDVTEKKPQAVREPPPSIDAALNMIAARTPDKVVTHLTYLCLRVLPLLEIADQKMHLNIAEPLALIRARLEKW